MTIEKISHFLLRKNLRIHPFTGPAPGGITIHKDIFVLGLCLRLSAPLVRFSISAANIRHSRSRKSPSVIVPPGNWWDILKICAATALPNRDVAITAGAAKAPESTCRRLKIMIILPIVVRGVNFPTWNVTMGNLSKQQPCYREI